MNKTMKIVIVVGLVIVAGIVIAVKQYDKTQSPEQTPATSPDTATVPETQPLEPEDSSTAENLPKLVDLGAGKCIPCKMMAPILEELKQTYAGQLDIVFIDVWENPDEAKKYGINLIPTQIFYDKNGEEVFRHEGFFSKEDILTKWKELGVEVKPTP